MELIRTYGLLGGMSILAGMVNSVAGGGTLLTFPALLAVISPVAANATSTIALAPGAISAAWGFRRELASVKRWILFLAVPSLIGGIVGALLLTILPVSYFNALIPWLILTAATLFLLQPWLSKLRGKRTEISVHPGALVAIAFFQLIVSVYGGYFGAGMGILMLSALGLMGFSDIHHMNALKSCLGFFINGVSAVVFVWKGQIDWRFAPLMAVGAILGGYLGARVSRRLNRTLVRWMVTAIGFILAAHFFISRS